MGRRDDGEGGRGGMRVRTAAKKTTALWRRGSPVHLSTWVGRMVRDDEHRPAAVASSTPHACAHALLAPLRRAPHGRGERGGGSVTPCVHARRGGGGGGLSDSARARVLAACELSHCARGGPAAPRCAYPSSPLWMGRKGGPLGAGVASRPFELRHSGVQPHQPNVRGARPRGRAGEVTGGAQVFLPLPHLGGCVTGVADQSSTHPPSPPTRLVPQGSAGLTGGQCLIHTKTSGPVAPADPRRPINEQTRAWPAGWPPRVARTGGPPEGRVGSPRSPVLVHFGAAGAWSVLGLGASLSGEQPHWGVGATGAPAAGASTRERTVTRRVTDPVVGSRRQVVQPPPGGVRPPPLRDTSCVSRPRSPP